jgi:hypothetical protein
MKYGPVEILSQKMRKNGTHLSMLIGDYALRKTIDQKQSDTACAS